jgi:hypothetical protein
MGAFIPKRHPLRGIKNESKSAKIIICLGAIFCIYWKRQRAAVGANMLLSFVSN